MRDKRLKYLSRQDGSAFEEFLFDLAHDPGEAVNLMETRAADAASLKQQLAAWEQEVQPLRKRPQP